LHKLITVNSSWRMVPDCDVLYASDYAWWNRHHDALHTSAERWTNNRKAELDFGCQRYAGLSGLNSGLAAIILAAWFGAGRVLLIGYDCQATGGKAHWHPPHKGNNPNEMSYKIWQKQFRSTGKTVRDRVVNCSRTTALTVFRRSTLKDALQTAPLDHEPLLVGA
jgi:hypothetical protein